MNFFKKKKANWAIHLKKKKVEREIMAIIIIIIISNKLIAHPEACQGPTHLSKKAYPSLYFWSRVIV